MALTIMTTGLEQYAPGGSARLQMLVIGGPGAGKTRVASYWPKPFYLDMERGLASVADRKVPFVTIKNSHDMFEALEFLKVESMKPDEQRNIQTVVVDTLDAFQRRVKDEWIQQSGKDTFTGYDAWNYLDAKMQMLMTRLLNLDLNVIVNVHYKDKVIKDDDSGRESREIMLQLSGSSADTAFNDFDLVGWMGTYWEPVDGKRIEKRGLTFKRTPDKPFLKDRLFVAPEWMEVTFAETDYTNLFTRLNERIAGLTSCEAVGEVPTVVNPAALPGGGVVTPGQSGSGPLPPMDPREIPLAQLTKPDLQKRAKDLGVAFKSNDLKSELITAIEAKLASDAAAASKPTEAPAVDEAPAEVPVEMPEEQPTEAPAEAPEPQETEAVSTTNGTEEVDITTGQIVEPEVTEEEALKNLEGLGAEVISEQPAAEPVQVPDTPATPPVQAEAAATPAATDAPTQCADCGGSFEGSHPDRVRLSFIKYRKHLCEPCYMARKK